MHPLRFTLRVQVAVQIVLPVDELAPDEASAKFCSIIQTCSQRFSHQPEDSLASAPARAPYRRRAPGLPMFEAMERERRIRERVERVMGSALCNSNNAATRRAIEAVTQLWLEQEEEYQSSDEEESSSESGDEEEEEEDSLAGLPPLIADNNSIESPTQQFDDFLLDDDSGDDESGNDGDDGSTNTGSVDGSADEDW